MQLLDFCVQDEPGVVLRSDAPTTTRYDLHNFVDFVGLTYDVATRTLQLAFAVHSDVSNPWGDPSNKASGCTLVFREVGSLSVSPRDEAMPVSEDLTLEWCGRAEKGLSTEDSWEFPHSEQSTVFRLAFRGGTAIEVVSSTIELVPHG
jgi:hypothetical protein